MATATIVGGAHVQLTLDSREAHLAQQALFAAEQGYAHGFVLGSTSNPPHPHAFNVYNINPATNGHSYVLPAGGQALALYGTHSANIFGHTGKEVLIGNAGKDFINAEGGNGTVIAGTGSDTIDLNTPGHAGGPMFIATGGNDTINMWGGRATISGDSHTDKVTLFSGGNTIDALSRVNVYVGVNQSDQVTLTGYGNRITLAGNDTVTLHDGAATITLQGSDVLNLAGGENDTITGNGQIHITDNASYHLGFHGNDTITFGSGGDTVMITGTATAISGAGGTNFRVVTGSASMHAGSGASTLIGGSGNDTFTGGAGPVSMVGGRAHNYFTGGAGHETMTASGTSNLFTFTTLHGGGHDTIQAFRHGRDHINLQGYDTAAALSSETHSGGNTTLHLGDGTTITLIGVSSITASDIIH